MASMFDAFYAKEEQRLRDAQDAIEQHLNHEVKAQPETTNTDTQESEDVTGRRRPGRTRNRAVFSQTEFPVDLAEYHAVHAMQPILRVRGRALDLEKARVRGSVSLLFCLSTFSSPSRLSPSLSVSPLSLSPLP